MEALCPVFEAGVKVAHPARDATISNRGKGYLRTR